MYSIHMEQQPVTKCKRGRKPKDAKITIMLPSDFENSQMQTTTQTSEYLPFRPRKITK